MPSERIPRADVRTTGSTVGSRAGLCGGGGGGGGGVERKDEVEVAARAAVVGVMTKRSAVLRERTFMGTPNAKNAVITHRVAEVAESLNNAGTRPGPGQGGVGADGIHADRCGAPDPEAGREHPLLPAPRQPPERRPCDQRALKEAQAGQERAATSAENWTIDMKDPCHPGGTEGDCYRYRVNGIR